MSRHRALLAASQMSGGGNTFPMTLELGASEENKIKIQQLCKEALNHIIEYSGPFWAVYNWKLEENSLVIDGNKIGYLSSSEYYNGKPETIDYLMATEGEFNDIKYYELHADTGLVELYID